MHEKANDFVENQFYHSCQRINSLAHLAISPQKTHLHEYKQHFFGVDL